MAYQTASLSDCCHNLHTQSLHNLILKVPREDKARYHPHISPCTLLLCWATYSHTKLVWLSTATHCISLQTVYIAHKTNGFDWWSTFHHRICAENQLCTGCSPKYTTSRILLTIHYRIPSGLMYNKYWWWMMPPSDNAALMSVQPFLLRPRSPQTPHAMRSLRPQGTVLWTAQSTLPTDQTQRWTSKSTWRINNTVLSSGTTAFAKK